MKFNGGRYDWMRMKVSFASRSSLRLRRRFLRERNDMVTQRLRTELSGSKGLPWVAGKVYICIHIR